MERRAEVLHWLCKFVVVWDQEERGWQNMLRSLEAETQNFPSMVQEDVNH